jgi:lipopolysaccharide biosynthesis regulator YciM
MKYLRPIRSVLIVLLLSIFLVGCGETDYEKTYRVAKELSSKGSLTDTEYVRRLATSQELLEDIASIKIEASKRKLYVLEQLLDHYEKLDMWPEARKVADRLVELQPTNIEWYLHLGRIHSNLSKVDDSHIKPAERAFKTALEMDPNSIKANYGIGVLYGFRKGNIEQGRRYLEKAGYDNEMTVQNKPIIVDARFALGKLEYQNNNFRAARETFKSILDMTSISTSARAIANKNLGDVYRAMNSTDLAKQAYLRSYDLDPTNSQVRSRLRELGVEISDRFGR